MEKIVTMKTGELIPYKNNPRKKRHGGRRCVEKYKSIWF